MGHAPAPVPTAAQEQHDKKDRAGGAAAKKQPVRSRAAARDTRRSFARLCRRLSAARARALEVALQDAEARAELELRARQDAQKRLVLRARELATQGDALGAACEGKEAALAAVSRQREEMRCMLQDRQQLQLAGQPPDRGERYVS